MKQTLKQIIEIGTIKLEQIAIVKWQNRCNSLLTRDKFKEAIRLAIINDGFFKEFTGHKGRDGASKAMNIIATNIQNRPGQINWERYILELAGYKKCPTCKKVKSLKETRIIKDTKSGKKYHGSCNNCDNEKLNKTFGDKTKKEIIEDRKESYKRRKVKDPGHFKNKSAKRRADKLNRTPKWSEEGKIKEFYTNCLEGYHVDHIIPLNGELVSGLHVLDNLQYLLASDNFSKKNKFDIVEFNKL